MPDTAARIVTEGRLRLAASPIAELGDAAQQAQAAAGIPIDVGADFIIVAVKAGTATDELARKLARRALEITA